MTFPTAEDARRETLEWTPPSVVLDAINAATASGRRSCEFTISDEACANSTEDFLRLKGFTVDMEYSRPLLEHRFKVAW